MVENLKIQRILFPAKSPMKVKQLGEKQQNGQDRRFERHLEKEENDERDKIRSELIDPQDVDANNKIADTNEIVFHNDHMLDNEKVRQIDIMV